MPKQTVQPGPSSKGVLRQHAPVAYYYNRRT
jgi:hypothetical protein